MNEITIKIVAGLAGAGAAAVLWTIGRVERQNKLTAEEFQRLWERHKMTYWLTYPACLAGILFPLWLYEHGGYPETDWRPAGLGIGLMIALPLAVVILRTLPAGKDKLAEFWKIYLHRYNVGVMGIALVYGVCLAIGIIALLRL